MSTRGNYGYIADNKLALATYNHHDMYPDGWGYKLAMEAIELHSLGVDFVGGLAERALAVRVCADYDSRECYFSHRPRVESTTHPGEMENVASFRKMLELDELYPASVVQGDIAYSYWWNLDIGTFTVEVGPLPTQEEEEPPAAYFFLDDPDMHNMLLPADAEWSGPRGREFAEWVNSNAE